MKAKRPNNLAAWDAAEQTGRGRGFGSEYRPWLETRDLTYSQGMRCRLPVERRIVHTLSRAEKCAFLLFDWEPGVTDIYEQYALNPYETQCIAKELGYAHPRTGAGICVMSSDFVVHSNRNGVSLVRAFQIKASHKDAENARTKEKLEIERLYWEKKNIAWRVLYAEDFNPVLCNNLDFLLPYRHRPCSRQDLSYMHGLLLEVMETFSTTSVKSIEEANVPLPGGTTISAREALMILTGKKLVHFPVESHDITQAILSDFSPS